MTRLLRLTARGPWHLGARGVGMEGSETLVGADTLFSAMCHAWQHLYGDLDMLLGPFLDGAPPFRISSAFPFGPEGWYPVRPQRASLSWGDAKLLKKVRYVHQDAWAAWADGNEPNEGGWSPDGAFLCPVGGKAPLMVESVPHVALDRQTSASNLYFTGEVHFRCGCGMALLVDAEDEVWHERVQAMLGWLGDAGLGGERTSGRGQFDLDVADAPVAFGSGEHVALLSPYAPAGALEITGWDLVASSYALAARRGFMEAGGGGGLRRKSLRVFAEGSVLQRKSGAGDAAGVLADVTPDAFGLHRVYRYGLPFNCSCCFVSRGLFFCISSTHFFIIKVAAALVFPSIVLLNSSEVVVPPLLSG